MIFDSIKPQLRSLEIRPYQQNGRSYFRLRDPQQLSNKVILVPQALALLLALCDGTRTARALATDFSAHYGVGVPLSVVHELLGALDEALMLESAHTAQAHTQALAAYRQVPFRTPILAGISYPAEASQLWRLLQDYLEGAEAVTPLAPDWSRPIGLLSPHIDYPRGGSVYAQVWKRAAQAAQAADLVVLFGTDHYGNDPFTLTRQNYATPYGMLPTAQPVVEALASVLGEAAAFSGELRHRTEHSLELVALWLHHMRGGAPVDLVPLLVGGFHHFMANGAMPAPAPTIQQVLATLRLSTQERRVLVVASGDLAHVGPALNGRPLDATGRKRVGDADLDLIAQMRAGDPEKFLAAIKQVGDRNNVCGVAPVYLALHMLGAVQSEQWGYATCPADEHGTSIVTVCGMMFY